MPASSAVDRDARRWPAPGVVRPELPSWLMSVVLWGAMVAIFGWAVLPWIILQAVWGFSLLEVVNYLEHYGLVRQKTASGRYERCAPSHSWNSDHICTNVFLRTLNPVYIASLAWNLVAANLPGHALRKEEAGDAGGHHVRH